MPIDESTGTAGPRVVVVGSRAGLGRALREMGIEFALWNAEPRPRSGSETPAEYLLSLVAPERRHKLSPLIDRYYARRFSAREMAVTDGDLLVLAKTLRQQHLEPSSAD